jgi:hypothetical protein
MLSPDNPLADVACVVDPVVVNVLVIDSNATPPRGLYRHVAF